MDRVGRAAVSAAALVVAAAALGGCARSGGSRGAAVMFNQDVIGQRWVRSGMALEGVDFAASVSRPGHDDELRVIGPDEGVSFDDPRSVMRFVLAHAPQEAVVLPTERYFYFRFHLGERVVSGNLRFTDIERGVLHTGYFDAMNLESSRHASFGTDEGVVVAELADGRRRVSMDGVSRDFALATAALRLPRALELGEGEEFVTGVLDESGTPLAMLWNEPASAFYFVLNPDYGSPEPLTPFGADGDYFVARDSRFVYHRDELARLVLVGVRAQNVQDNSYYDGPFDQVPPNLPLKAKLERAYPYVTMRGGIDEHGNFVDLDSSRVAISPYLQYSTFEEVEAWLDTKKAMTAAGPARLAAMTYEAKRDFHKVYQDLKTPTTLGEVLALRARAIESLPHALYTSQGWPANHRVESSDSWPASHERASSGAWPKNHEGATSSQRAGDPERPIPAAAAAAR